MDERALVVGYDGSDCAKAALEAAIQFAGKTGDRIVIGFGYEPGSYGEEHSAHREEVRKFGERVTAPAIERTAEAGVEATLALIAERPVDALVALAAEHDARAIVVGTHSESPLRGAILGSTPHKLLHVAECPVLVVPVRDVVAGSATRLTSPAMSDAYNRLAELPVTVESYELTGHDVEFAEFTRPSTVVHLRGSGKEGIGEDVVYTVLDHIAHRDAGPVLAGELAGERTLGELCDVIGMLDLFPTPPEYPASANYRRWAYESAALDLALNQNGLALWEVVERDPSPLRFVCSTRLTSFGDGGKGSSTAAIERRLAKYPELEFKLDPENDWDRRADRGDRRPGAGADPRSQGALQGHSGRRRYRSRALPHGRRGVPRRLHRGSRSEREDEEGTR